MQFAKIPLVCRHLVEFCARLNTIQAVTGCLFAPYCRMFDLDRSADSCYGLVNRSQPEFRRMFTASLRLGEIVRGNCRFASEDALRRILQQG
jgi:hypothetical protein